MDNRDDTFDTLAELVFWVCITILFALIVMAGILTYPHLDLSRVFWPGLALGTLAIVSLGYLLVRPPRLTQRIAAGGVGIQVGGNLNGHLRVNVELAELNTTLNANRNRYGTRAGDVPLQKPWPRHAGQPSTRTPDQYSRSTDPLPADFGCAADFKD